MAEQRATAAATIRVLLVPVPAASSMRTNKPATPAMAKSAHPLWTAKLEYRCSRRCTMIPSSQLLQ